VRVTDEKYAVYWATEKKASRKDQNAA